MYKLVFAYSLLDFQQSPDYKIIFCFKIGCKITAFFSFLQSPFWSFLVFYYIRLPILLENFMIVC